MSDLFERCVGAMLGEEETGFCKYLGAIATSVGAHGAFVFNGRVGEFRHFCTRGLAKRGMPPYNFNPKRGDPPLAKVYTVSGDGASNGRPRGAVEGTGV